MVNCARTELEYEPQDTLNRTENVLQSCLKGKEYLQNYINRNGTNYYIVIVEYVRWSEGPQY